MSLGLLSEHATEALFSKSGVLDSSLSAVMV